ncbi:lipase secretion chaperone [Piscinibacter sp. HJYY11]|uniref:lipase secretion chaperone n=1 Tax=Piscinibacter sp. HJYY11 TaxID=2801333 RepID=UPI00191DBC40|nr:lipase secretion chaperone [Piscinibacter sp. HJYY11]MBL0726847.1 hypothetical protein [Piscinibacter sp. HJYY11]
MSVHINDSPVWKRPAFWALAGAVAVIGAVGWQWFGSPADLYPAAETAQRSDSAQKQISSAASGASGGAVMGDNGLVEVDVLGARMDVSRLFQLGFGGGLNVDGETRATLDTLMTQLSDPPSQKELEKLEYTLRQGLPKEEADRALKLLQGYRSYQTDLRAEGAQLGIPETQQSVDEYFAQVGRIQRRHFDEATATALFGADIRNARAVMMAAVIDQNPNLSLAQKKEQIDALRAELPPEQRGTVPEPGAGAAPEAK